MCKNIGASRHIVHVLTTGIGAVSAAFATTRRLCDGAVDLVIHAGTCGSFDRTVPIGEVVYITEEIFSDLGAEDADGGFLDLETLGFPQFVAERAPVYNRLKNPNCLADFTNGLTEVTSGPSLTVQTVHGCGTSIEAVLRRFQPRFETMEGGGVALACLRMHVPYLEFRAVSNYVEPRDPSKWDVAFAIRNIQSYVITLILHLKDRSWS